MPDLVAADARRHQVLEPELLLFQLFFFDFFVRSEGSLLGELREAVFVLMMLFKPVPKFFIFSSECLSYFVALIWHPSILLDVKCNSILPPPRRSVVSIATH